MGLKDTRSHGLSTIVSSSLEGNKGGNAPKTFVISLYRFYIIYFSGAEDWTRAGVTCLTSASPQSHHALPCCNPFLNFSCWDRGLLWDPSKPRTQCCLCRPWIYRFSCLSLLSDWITGSTKEADFTSFSKSAFKSGLLLLTKMVS